MNSYWLPNVIPLIFPITVIPTNPYYIPYQLPITMPTNLIPIIIPFLVLLYSPTSQTTQHNAPHLRGHIDHGRRGGRQGRLHGGPLWERLGTGSTTARPNKKKTSKNGELTMKKLVILPWKMGFNPKKNVYEPTDMMILPTGIWISHIQKPDQRGIQPDKGRIEPGKMGSSPK